MQTEPSSFKFIFVTVAPIIAIVFIVLFACSKSKDTTNITDCSGASFSQNAHPVIQANCATNSGCHGAGSTNGPGELLNYSEIFNARLAIRAAVASGEMPLNNTLSNSDKNSILCWIDNNAPDN